MPSSTGRIEVERVDRFDGGKIRSGRRAPDVKWLELSHCIYFKIYQWFLSRSIFPDFFFWILNLLYSSFCLISKPTPTRGASRWDNQRGKTETSCILQFRGFRKWMIGFLCQVVPGISLVLKVWQKTLWLRRVMPDRGVASVTAAATWAGFLNEDV